jgi:hypothetical protein
MLPHGPIVALPFVPGEEFEVYAVMITLGVSFLLLFLFGQYWQK